MKLTCLAFALGALLAIPALAQSTDATTAPAATPPPAAAKPTPPPRPPPLTKEESAEVTKAYAAAIKDDPDLAAQQTALQDKMKALGAQQKDLDAKVITAMAKADPDFATILATHPNLRPPHQQAASPKKEAKPAKPKAPAKPKTSSTPSTNSPSATPPASTN